MGNFSTRKNYVFYINFGEFIVFKLYDTMEELRSVSNVIIKFLSCNSLKIVLNDKLLE